jgi:hypothetical protein
MQTFLDLFSAQSRGNKIDDILLIGKCVNDDISLFFSENTGLPCRVLTENYQNVSKLGRLNSRQLCESFAAVAAGLANINVRPLIPPENRTAEEKHKFVVRLSIVTAFALIITTGLHLGGFIHLQNINSELQSRREIIGAIEGSTGYQGYLTLVGTLNRSSSYLTNLDNQTETHCHILLKELSLSLPDQTRLNSAILSVEEDRYILSLDGNVKLRDFSPEIVLAQYVRVLEKSVFFRNVKVTSHRKRQNNGEFDLNFQMKMDTRI